MAQPAAGPSGTVVALSGVGFGRGVRVTISVAGRRVARPRSGPHGHFSRAVTIPATAVGRVKISARRGKRRVVLRFTVTTRPGATAISEAATARRARIRWTPRAGIAGTPIYVRGIALRHRRPVALRFAPANAVGVATGPRGGFKRAIAIPQTSPGAHTFTVRGAGLSLRLPFTVLPDPVIAGAGDIACGANSGSAQCEQMATSNLLLQLHPAAVLALGDTQYENGELANYLHFYAPSWGRLKAITHPVVGNHEYGTSNARTCGGACGYFDYFDGVGRRTGRAGTRNQGWYAYNVGAWRLYAMNSNCSRIGGCDANSPQLRWFKADLAAHPRACTLMYMHHPLFTSDKRDFDTAKGRALLRPLWQAFYDRGGDVVLTGHSHFYERYAPQDPFEHPNAKRGIRQFIVGTGGRNVYTAPDVEPTSQVRGENTFGVLRLALHSHGYDWRFVPIPGSTFTDAGSQRCH